MSMMTRVKSLLAFPASYRFAIGVFGNPRNRQWFVDEVLRVSPGDRLVDIGCGPAEIFRRLPSVQYIGCDVNESYLAAARKEFGDRGVFIAGRCEDWERDSRSHAADIVLANGVLHHVDDDELLRILAFAHRVLKPGGRFIFYEPCYLIWQSRTSAFLMAHDRGQHIRKEQEWKDVVGRVFGQARTNVVTDVNRLGYTCIIGECVKEGVPVEPTPKFLPAVAPGPAVAPR
jgi:SAM-dependent methyltransferase